MVIKCSTFTQISTRHKPWCLADSYDFIARFLRGRSHDTGCNHPLNPLRQKSTNLVLSKRYFHNYFLTNIPSLRSDPTSSVGIRHKLSESDSNSQQSRKCLPSSNTLSTIEGAVRESTVVRIPLKSAKQHFGVSQSRGNRPCNEDTYQAGTIEIPAFAKKASVSHNFGTKYIDVADSASGGPQVFCFGVFDGHGGKECSEFLKDKLHEYIEETADLFKLGSSLQRTGAKSSEKTFLFDLNNPYHETLVSDKSDTKEKSSDLQGYSSGNVDGSCENSIVKDHDNHSDVNSEMEKIFQLEKSLIQQWKDTVGGYFRRFKPHHFSYSSRKSASIESVLMYAFLRADLDFISAQANRPESEKNNSLSLDAKSSNIKTQNNSSPARFLGGSTASIALISTPTPTPFWHPSSPCTMIVAHVGDTRIILCMTATGLAKPCTVDHHPSSPGESNRLRRYATSFVTDSFGEERLSGLANTRAFGDIHSKRIGVSAEPDIYRIDLMASEYSMLVLVSDGVSGTLNDQEIVDIIKEAETPERGARDVVSFATEVSKIGDNATCLVVRLGGWEKRREGGLGSLGTVECREWRRRDASDMRRVERHR